MSFSDGGTPPDSDIGSPVESETDVDGDTPSDKIIQTTLWKTVVDFFKADDLEFLTLKRVRAEAAEKLGLPEEFFKTDAKWKNKSKEIINGEVVGAENSAGHHIFMLSYHGCITRHDKRRSIQAPPPARSPKESALPNHHPPVRLQPRNEILHLHRPVLSHPRNALFRLRRKAINRRPNPPRRTPQSRNTRPSRVENGNLKKPSLSLASGRGPSTQTRTMT